MALDTAKFMEVQKRAKKIMEMGMNGKLDNIAKKQSGTLNENGDIDFGNVELTSNNNRQTIDIAESRNFIPSASSKNVPKAILESFSKNQINVDGFDGSVNGSSVLDTLGIPSQPKQQRQIAEAAIPQQQIAASSQGIDYSLIKTIVEDSVRKMIPSIKKSILTESKTSGDDLALIKIGESFKFVSKNGDIFEARLKKVGNVNKQ